MSFTLSVSVGGLPIAKIDHSTTIFPLFLCRSVICSAYYSEELYTMHKAFLSSTVLCTFINVFLIASVTQCAAYVHTYVCVGAFGEHICRT